LHEIDDILNDNVPPRGVIDTGGVWHI